MIAGHAGAGKTTLAEALLKIAGETERLGRIDEGNTVMDFDAEEIRRKSSLSSAMASLEYDGVKMNLVDVPGLFDFEMGVYEGIMAAESVLITVSARSGVAVGAQKAYKLAEKYGKAKMIYISKLDKEHADFYKVFEQLKTQFGPSICPIVVPHMDGKSIIYVNLIEEKAYSYMAGKPQEVPMPDMGHRFEGLKTAMHEAVAETDEKFMEKFFDGQKFTQEELIEGVRVGVKTGAITPVLCGNSSAIEATDMLLRYSKKLLPSAQRGANVKVQTKTGEQTIACDEQGPLVGYVFKTVADPFIGKLSFVKVMRGNVKSETTIMNARLNETEKIGKLLFINGKKQKETAEITAGDIGALTKLNNVKTGDTLCDNAEIVEILPIELPTPTYVMALKPKQKGDESKISSSVQRLIEEDETVGYMVDEQTAQQLISGLGEQHLEVVLSKMKNKFGVEATLSKPKIAYRETLRKAVKEQGKYKKQTGGHGQFGDVVIEFSPIEGNELVFEEKVFGGSVPKNFFPAVEKGLREAVAHGVLTGYPMVGIKATLLDGSYHPVDSSEMAFRMAAKMAYKNALPKAAPTLLEPIGLLQAYVPDSNTGDLMGEVNKRRGRVLGMNPKEDATQCIEAEVPVSEMYDFTTYMRQLTQGRGTFDFSLTKYEPVPENLQEDIIKEAAKEYIEKEEELS